MINIDSFIIGLVVFWGGMILLLGYVHGFPIYLTCYNIRRLFHLKQNDAKWKGEKSKHMDLLIFLWGPVLMGILYIIWAPDHWQRAIAIRVNYFPSHEPITSDYGLTFFVLCLAAWGGFMILRFTDKKLPPLLTVLCMGTIYLGCFLSVAFIIQVLPNTFESFCYLPTECILMCLFPLNYIFSSVAAISNVIQTEEKLES